MSVEVTASVVIAHEVGLHARPSVKLTKLAKGFAAKIEIATDPAGPWIDAKSIVKVMAMKAKQNSTLFVRATGADAQAAVDAVTGLVTRETLKKSRPYVFLGAFVLGMLLTPPDVFSQTLLAIPMYGLFEGALLFCGRFTPKRQ